LDGILPGVYSCRAPRRAKEMYEIELNGAKATSYFIDSKFRHHEIQKLSVDKTAKIY